MNPRNAALTTAVIVTGILATFVILDGTVMGTLLGRVTLPNSGNIKAMGVGVYWDSDCSDVVTSIDWGTVEPGSTNSVTVYVKNEGNAAETLSSETENWSPPGTSTYMSLTWDYGGQIIDVGGVVQVTLSLSVSETIDGITNFGFDIVITGSD
ncbi:MAG: hypothetical protein JSV85_05000 [Candidatus Bathyarchaeota archaeon]|nr:MAG: hypothetical protein JSV85_05000 [Candidatus Bathyarchaeota archaeon]